MEVVVVEQLVERAARLNHVEDAMERLRLGRSKIFELMASGQLRSVKVGRRRLIPEQAIIDFIARLDKQAKARP